MRAGSDSPTTAKAPSGVEIWITISTCLVAGGWILSALGQLNELGYAAVLALTAALCWRLHLRGSKRRPLASRLRRFRRPLPLLFLVLAGCALLGGLLYAPANWDALSYRVPRVLNWLTAERWHWIESA